MSSVGLGFAGLGVAGKTMLDQLSKVPGLRLAAVQDANLNLAEQIAEQFASPWHGEQFEDLLAAPSVDAVVICTPNAFHVRQAQAALRAGKQVLVQKPLATTAGDARATLALADERGRLLFVDYSYRFLDTAETLRETLPQIGPVRTVSAVFHNVHGPRAGRDWFFDPKLSGGGALIDLGVHMLDMLLWLLKPQTITVQDSKLEHRSGLQVEHNASMDLRFDRVPVLLRVSWDAPLPLTEIALELQGDRGRLRWNNVDGSFAHFQTWLNQTCLIDREITLRENTLRRFATAQADGAAPPVDIRVYDLLDGAYGRA
jgi:predicted dehydrogenase